jgi:hypothetical protein
MISKMISRMINASKLNIDTYEEIEADKSATVQALLVVLITAIATAIGITWSPDSQNISSFSFVSYVVTQVVSWAIWAFITFFVGTKFLKTTETHADWGELARTLGFAQSPNILRIFGFIPFIGTVIFTVTFLWSTYAMVIAVRQALDYQSTRRAVGVVLIGFIPYIFIMGIIGQLVP